MGHPEIFMGGAGRNGSYKKVDPRPVRQSRGAITCRGSLHCVLIADNPEALGE